MITNDRKYVSFFIFVSFSHYSVHQILPDLTDLWGFPLAILGDLQPMLYLNCQAVPRRESYVFHLKPVSESNKGK